MKHADILKISEEELCFITGITDVEKGSLMLQQQFGIAFIVVTIGEQGAITGWAHEGYVPGFQVNTIDTTGAGDAFLSCLLYKILECDISLNKLEKQQIISMLTFANAGGALVTTRKGALQSMPTIDEINKIMESNKQMDEI